MRLKNIEKEKMFIGLIFVLMVFLLIVIIEDTYCTYGKFSIYGTNIFDSSSDMNIENVSNKGGSQYEEKR